MVRNDSNRHPYLELVPIPINRCQIPSPQVCNQLFSFFRTLQVSFSPKRIEWSEGNCNDTGKNSLGRWHTCKLENDPPPSCIQRKGNILKKPF
ncbi:hypothetical protein NPIL_40271 [Nephila pilipes]|uniref:Uncharacterized protein n=1 Tax=Nephila pilipes TaxID=299642 RepID=A0A8X6Q5B0_NEPPI|nr:hypothetical protein NPIL_40271 [Nephila pilipes]